MTTISTDFEALLAAAEKLAREDREMRFALVEARRSAGMTQADVAEALGVKQSTIAAFERYDNDPRLSTIRRYALAVGVSISHTVTPSTSRSANESAGSGAGASKPDLGWGTASSPTAGVTSHAGTASVQVKPSPRVTAAYSLAA